LCDKLAMLFSTWPIFVIAEIAAKRIRKSTKEAQIFLPRDLRTKMDLEQVRYKCHKIVKYPPRVCNLKLDNSFRA
jgi:hypothetical protein